MGQVEALLAFSTQVRQCPFLPPPSKPVGFPAPLPFLVNKQLLFLSRPSASELLPDFALFWDRGMALLLIIGLVGLLSALGSEA